MNAKNIFDVMGGLVLVALVTTVVTSKNTASQITAASKGFAMVIDSAVGKSIR